MGALATLGAALVGAAGGAAHAALKEARGGAFLQRSCHTHMDEHSRLQEQAALVSCVASFARCMTI